MTIAQRKKTFSIYVTPTVRASRGEYPSRMLLGNGKQEENAELPNYAIFVRKTLEKNQSQKRKCDLKERKSRLGEEDSDYDRNGHNCPRLLNLRTVDLCKNYKLYISLRKKVRSGGRKRSTEEKKKVLKSMTNDATWTHVEWFFKPSRRQKYGLSIETQGRKKL